MRTPDARRRMQGAAAIEFALVFLALWFVVLSCWVAGTISMQRNMIKDAARNAAMLVVNATPAELATPAAISALEQRAEDQFRAAIESAGHTAPAIDIDRDEAINGYDPSLSVVRVSVEASISENVFGFGIEHSLDVSLEVPYGGRLAGP